MSACNVCENVYVYVTDEITTLHRRSHSRVVTLKDITGLWLTGDPLLAHINDTLHKLFQATSEYHRHSLRSVPRVCLASPFLEHSQTLSTIPPPPTPQRDLEGP